MPTDIIFSITLTLATLLTTMVAGFLFGFAVITMPGIKGLTDREFIRAFQGMDGIIQNNHPLFMLVWGGSVLFVVIAAVMGFGQVSGIERIILIAATIIYVVGVQLPTITINVPLNNTLQTIDVAATDEDAHHAARVAFEPRWNQWNNIRTVLATVAALLLIIVALMH